MTRTTAILVVLAAAALAGCAPATETPVADPASRRDTPQGPVVGSVGPYDSHVWRGIPYAAPPVGAWRWRAPQPAAAWTEPLVALTAGSPCPQYTSQLGGVEGEAGTIAGAEDCLYANVWAPRWAAGEVPRGEKRVPVMVWIHGGGNSMGQGAFYNGGRLATERDVIVVTFNYRLGPLGWFRHAALRGDGTTPADRSGNYGTLDQIRLLEWVRDNIDAFGGDPANVTIFGESAGGLNVLTLLVAPSARGLFHRAITQSGSTHTEDPLEAEAFRDAVPPGDEHSSNEAIASLLVQRGVQPNRDAAKRYLEATDGPTLERYLREQTASDILRAYDGQKIGMIEMPKIFRDGTVLPEAPTLELLAQADGSAPVPVMLGTNRDENKLFMYLNPHLVRQILGFIPRVRDERMYNLTAEYMAKMWKAIGVDEPARALHAGGRRDVYAYRFDWDEQPTILGADLSMLLGASHGFEIPFVFGHFDLGKAGNVMFTHDNLAGREELAQRMMSYWAEFAHRGKPGRGRSNDPFEWQAWGSVPQGQYVVFDTKAGGDLRMSDATVGRESLLEALANDARLAEPRDRCAVLRSLVKWSWGVEPEKYTTAAGGVCAAYPIDAFPWS